VPAGNSFLHIINFARGLCAHTYMYIVFASGKKVCVGVDKEQHTDHYPSVGRSVSNENECMCCGYGRAARREQDRGEWNAL